MLKGGVTPFTHFQSAAVGASRERVDATVAHGQDFAGAAEHAASRATDFHAPLANPTRRPPSASRASYCVPRWRTLPTGVSSWKSAAGAPASGPESTYTAPCDRLASLLVVERELRGGIEPKLHAVLQRERSAPGAAGADHGAGLYDAAGGQRGPVTVPGIHLHVADDTRERGHGAALRQVKRSSHPDRHRRDRHTGRGRPARESPSLLSR